MEPYIAVRHIYSLDTRDLVNYAAFLNGILNGYINGKADRILHFVSISYENVRALVYRSLTHAY